MFVREGYSMCKRVSSTRLPNIEVWVDSLASNGLWTCVCSTRKCDVALNLYRIYCCLLLLVALAASNTLMLFPTSVIFSKKFSFNQFYIPLTHLNSHCTFKSLTFTRSHHLSLIPPQSTINALIFVSIAFLWNSMPPHILQDCNPKSFWRYNFLCVN